MPVDYRRTTVGCLRRFATRLNQLAAPRRRGLDVAQPFTHPTVTERTLASHPRNLRVAALGGGTGLPNVLRHDTWKAYEITSASGLSVASSSVRHPSSTSPRPGGACVGVRGAGIRSIAVTPKDLAALQNLGVRALGAPLASEAPLGRIRHHPRRLAAALNGLCPIRAHVTG